MFREGSPVCRDALQHLPCAAVVDALQTFSVSRPKYLLVGSYPDGENRRIEAGEYFSIDLRLPPFSLGEGVIRSYEEWTSSFSRDTRDKQLLLVDGKFLAGLDFHQMKRGCVSLPMGQ